MKTDVDDDKKQDQWYELGIWSAKDSMAEELRRKSGEAFASKRFDEANCLRALADEYELEANKLRKEYDEKWEK